MRPYHILGFSRIGSDRLLTALLVVVALLVAVCPEARATAAPRVLDIRFSSSPERTRVVLDLSGPATWEVRQVDDPPRLALNLAGARFEEPGTLVVEDGRIRRVRCNEGRRRAQVVLDLTDRHAFRSFALGPAGGRPHRIVVDVFEGGDGAVDPQVAAAAPPEVRPYTVVIDAGHGGQDPGAMRAGLEEKDLTLAVARAMARRLEALPGYRAVLTRDRDRELSLAERVEIAAAERGDVFLSIHCNTHRRSQVSGMEVYFLSLQGASDRRAQDLADRENAADLVGMDRAAQADDLVLSVLLDLRAQRLLHESADLAECLLAVAGQDGLVRPRRVKQADFRVLHSLAMPSALVEVAYLSNREDQALLADPRALERVASGLVGGLLIWRQDDAAMAALGRELPALWTRDYRVRHGDNLWRLARNHGTTVSEITAHNNLASSALAVGQVLRLPREMHGP